MDETNISSILAFYNLLAAKIGLEDCRSLNDVRNLMPILANYMKFGTPSFVDDPNFGFCNATDVISHELDEEFHSQLHPEVAETGDVFESVKIHWAMIYTFRLLQTEAFLAICEQLEDKHQRHFANIIERLDTRQRWTFASWPKLLNIEQPGIGSDENKENREQGRLSFAHTPKTNSGRKLFFPIRRSPISQVVSSPRGEEVVRIHAYEKEVKKLREIRDVFGQEKDLAEELCHQKELECNKLMKANETLKSQLGRILPVAEQIPCLEGYLISIQDQIGSFAKALKEAQTTGANAQERAFNLQFELDEMGIKHGELQKEYEKVLNRAEDTTKKLEKAQEEARKFEGVAAQYKAETRELRNRMKLQAEEFNRRYDQKVGEFSLLQVELQQLKMDSEAKTSTRENSLFAEMNLLKSMDEMKKVQEEKHNLESELMESKRTMNELLEFAEQQQEIIARFDGERTELEEAQKRLEKAQKEARKFEGVAAQYKAETRELRNRMKLQEEEFNRRYDQKVGEFSLLQVELQQLKMGSEAKTSTRGNSKSMSVTFVSRTASSLSHQDAVSNFDSTNMNDDERVKELRERNRRYQPHMRSSYLPESAHLKNSEIDLTVMP